MRAYSYAETYRVGAWAVDVAAAWFRSKGLAAVQTPDGSEYQKRGVDIVVYKPGGEAIEVEVKGDRKTTGNIFIETVSNKNKETEGCILTTEAHALFYYIVRQGAALYIPLSELLYWIGSGNLNRYPVKTTGTMSRKGLMYQTEGRPVPIRDILDEVGKVKLIEGLPVWNGE